MTKVKKQLKFTDITVERVPTKKRKSELDIKIVVPDRVDIQPTLKKCKVVLNSIKIDEFLIEKKISSCSFEQKNTKNTTSSNKIQRF